jgi:N-acetylglucosaminyldiphosphoundecaprenol N-acetyl-beta-D-mannosaminyltransferase
MRSGAAPAPAKLFGFTISPASRGELTHAITRDAPRPGGGVRLVVTMNLDHVVRLQKDPEFRAAYRRAWAITADGAPIQLYGRLRGARTSRCAGSDLLVDLAAAFSPDRHRLFFVVSTPATGERLKARFEAAGFADGVAFASPPFGFETDAARSAALCDAIRRHRTTHLVLGLGAPKSEVWIDRHRAALGDIYACAFGSAPDFLVGTARRAPEGLRRLGLEWAWRVAHDPRRLWRRYFIDAWAFLPAVARDLLGRETAEPVGPSQPELPQ